MSRVVKNTAKLFIKKGDKVQILSGDYKGTKGEVLEVFPDKYRAIIEGVNIRKKHRKPSNDQPGGIEDINLPIHISNVALLDPKSGAPTRLKKERVNGKSVRIAKKSGEIIK